MYYTYMGRDINELNREELLEALRGACKEIASLHESSRKDAEMREFFRSAKRKRERLYL